MRRILTHIAKKLYVSPKIWYLIEKGKEGQCEKLICLLVLFVTLSGCANIAPVSEAQGEKLYLVAGHGIVASAEPVLTAINEAEYAGSDVTITLQSLYYADGLLHIALMETPNSVSDKSGSSSLRGIEAEFASLTMGETEYKTTTYYWRNFEFQYTTLELEFALNETPAAGSVCTLNLNGNGYDNVSLDLKLAEAQNLEKVSDLGIYCANSYVEIAASPQETDSGLRFELFCNNLTDYELVSYGTTGDPSYAGLAGKSGVYLSVDGQELYPQEHNTLGTYPSVLTFDASVVDDWTLHIPYVIFEETTELTIKECFDTEEELLTWSQTVEFDHCIVTFKCVKSDENHYGLQYSMKRDDSAFTAVALREKGSEILLADSTTNSENGFFALADFEGLEFECDLAGVQYAFVMEMSFETE